MTTSVCRLRANNNDNLKTANTRETTTTTQTATARRRPSNNTNIIKSAQLLLLLLLAILMSQLHQFTGGGGGGGGVFAMAAPTPASSTPVDATESNLLMFPPTRNRLQKRDDTLSFNQRFHLELNSSVLEWSNGCGGNWTGPQKMHIVRPSKRCAKHKKLLRTLQNKTGRELRQLKDENKFRHPVISLTAPDTSSNQAIDISQHAQWKVQASQYKFLPRLDNSSDHLPLRRVHHDLQFYVASFSYLRHAQLHYDYEYLQKQSVLSAELKRLGVSARNILCFVEETINGTIRLYGSKTTQTQEHRHDQLAPMALGRIKTVPRVPMEKRLLKFKTPLVELHKQAVLAARNQPAAKPQEPHILDALFLKYHYMQYLKQITQVLATQRKRNCKSSKPPTKAKLESKLKPKSRSKSKSNTRAKLRKKQPKVA